MTSYEDHMALGRRAVPDAAAMGGDQMLFNDVPIRPISLVGTIIRFDVPNPFRISLGLVPKGAGVMGAMVGVTVAFNASVTNVLRVGPLAHPDEIVEVGDVDEATVGTYLVCHRGGGILTEDTEYFVWFTQTGDAATTGEARVGLIYGIP